MTDRWPERPSLRFVIYWALRRERLCDRKIGCPHEERNERCPLDELEAAERAEAGQLLRRALDVRALLRLGANISPDEILADEFYALLVLEEERDRLEDENARSR